MQFHTSIAGSVAQQQLLTCKPSHRRAGNAAQARHLLEMSFVPPSPSCNLCHLAAWLQRTVRLRFQIGPSIGLAADTARPVQCRGARASLLPPAVMSTSGARWWTTMPRCRCEFRRVQKPTQGWHLLSPRAETAVKGLSPHCSMQHGMGSGVCHVPASREHLAADWQLLGGLQSV